MLYFILLAYSKKGSKKYYETYSGSHTYINNDNNGNI